MKRAFLIIALLMLLTTSQAAATCTDGLLEYGDSCQDDFRSRDEQVIYGFYGESGDLVTVTLTWEENTTAQLVMVGPIIEGDTSEEFALQEATEGDNGEAVLEAIDLPEDGLYGIAVTFDDDATYEILLEGESSSGDGGGTDDVKNDQIDSAFLRDTVLIFQTAEVPNSPNDGYFYDVQILNADGAETVINTGLDTYSSGCGDLSPDGESILYTTNQDGNGQTTYTHFEIYSARADGSNPQRLTETEADEIAPRWSPDGERIVFMASETPDDADSFEIFVMDADGGNLEQITDNNDADRFPAWSPDGERIIFHSNSDGDYELYTMTPEGDNVEQLTDNDWNDARAAYSPDGEFIVYNSNELGFDDLFIMDADGDNVEQLTDSDDNYEFGAVWSPDGEMIAFTSSPEVQVQPNEIWVMNADGSDAQPVFANSNVDFGLCDWNEISN